MNSKHIDPKKFGILLQDYRLLIDRRIPKQVFKQILLLIPNEVDIYFKELKKLNEMYEIGRLKLLKNELGENSFKPSEEELKLAQKDPDKNPLRLQQCFELKEALNEDKSKLFLVLCNHIAKVAGKAEKAFIDLKLERIQRKDALEKKTLKENEDELNSLEEESKILQEGLKDVDSSKDYSVEDFL